MPSHRRPLFWSTVAVLSVTMVVASGSSQDPQPRPTFRAAVNSVSLDVYPTLNGEPVTDLRQDEFEVFEDRSAQTIEQFERVTISTSRTTPQRREPTSLSESRDMAGDPRTRVFVLFLDTLHVDPIQSRTIGKPLIDLLDNLIGPDDVFAVMTPRMAGRDLTFARKTTGIGQVLGNDWWSERWNVAADDTERLYLRCYGPDGPTGAMTARHREELTLNALDDLVGFLRDVREERKAIITITQGWNLYRPDSGLAQQAPEGPISSQKVGVDPRTGTLTAKDTKTDGTDSSLMECQRDRLRLATIDHELRFEELLDRSNWANASFYPVDPRGLTSTSSLARPTNTLRRLAEETDGMAIVNTNNISAGLGRIVSDLSSYYLLGYRSTNDKQDGRFRRISVRVKRAGVQVRARRGYMAPAAGERPSPSTRVDTPESARAAAEDRAYSSAIGSLAGLTRELPLRVQIAAASTTGGAGVIWAVGEVATGEAWKNGGDADVRVIGPSGTTVAETRAVMASGSRSFRVRLTPSGPLEAGAYVVRVQVRLGAGATPLTDSLNVTLPAAPASAGALLVRRGPVTGNREVATTDPRVRRSEQLRVEIPARDKTPGSARLLDRTGKPLQVPLTTTVAEDGDGQLWRTAQLVAAPLSPGDYLVEISTPDRSEQRTLIGVRVVP